MFANLAVQAARLARVAAPYAPKAATAAKGLGVFVAVDVLFNEGIRIAEHDRKARQEEELHNIPQNQQTQRPGTRQRGEYRIANYPMWKVVAGIRPGETFTDSTKRHAKGLWDIVCYAAGDAIWWVNFVTVKPVKGVLGLAGSVLTVAASGIALVPVLIARMFGGITEERFARVFDKIVDFNLAVFLAPFRVVRWLDRKISGAARRLMRPRSYEKLQDENMRTTRTTTAAAAPAAAASNVAEIHVFHTVIDTEYATRAPREYGRKLFEYEMRQEGVVVAAQHRASSLRTQLVNAGLVDGVTDEILAGYDEAVVEAAAKTAA